MFNQLHLTIQNQCHLISYFDSGKWKEDLDKSLLTQKINQLQDNLNITLDLDQFISNDCAEYCKAYIFANQLKIREINHNLQSVFQISAEKRVRSEFVIASLPPRNINKLNRLAQILHMFKQNLSEIQEFHIKLQDIPQIDQQIEKINKKLGLLQIAENFKFELKCLQHELEESKTIMCSDYHKVQQELVSIIINKQLQNILSFCTAFQNMKLVLKKQRLVVKQFEVVDINDKYKSVFYLSSSVQECVKQEIKKHASSQETDYSYEKSPQKEIEVPKLTLVKDEACLCIIF